MAAGDSITKANLDTGAIVDQKYTTKSKTLYIAGTGFCVTNYFKTVGIIKKTHSATVSRWNGPGTTTFTQVRSQSTTTRGSTKQIINTHNYTHGSQDWGDTGDIHLYKVTLSSNAGGDATVYVRVQVYSARVSNCAVAGKYIYGMAPFVGTYSSDAAFVNAYYRTNFAGTPITWANRNYCYSDR